jgi:hypothetical protein
MITLSENIFEILAKKSSISLSTEANSFLPIYIFLDTSSNISMGEKVILFPHWKIKQRERNSIEKLIKILWKMLSEIYKIIYNYFFIFIDFLYPKLRSVINFYSKIG